MAGLAAFPFGVAIGTSTAGAGVRIPEAPQQPIYFGTAVTPEQLFGDPALRRAVVEECTCVTPEIHLKWSAIEWRPGQPWLANVDTIAAFARQNGMQVRGHTLLWDQTTPDWARAELESRADWGIVQRHFASLLPRHQDVIREWDVINEPLDTDAGENGLRRTIYQRAFGSDYIRRALDTAHELAPHARLMINDFSLEYDNPIDEARRNAMLRLVERLKAAGAPLGGVGLQAHLDLNKGALPQRRLQRFYQELASMGVDLVVTELDVREAQLSLPLDERDRRVAAEVRTFLDVALAEPALKGVVTWGLSDRYSWLQQQLPKRATGGSKGSGKHITLNRGLPYDAALSPKPMRQVIAESLNLARA